MSEKSMKTREKHGKQFLISLFIILLLTPVTLIISARAGGRRYYLNSVIVIVYAMTPFFIRFERKKPQARELVTIAVMSAISVASRAAFIMIPFFKPMSGIIMITGIAFGPEAGFLTGAVSGFVSNFIFGQGPWTPWQMFAFGIAGFLAGVLSKKGYISAEKRGRMAMIGGIVILLIVGPLLDTCTLLTMSSAITVPAALSIYISGLPVNVVHAAATVLTLYFLGRPILEKLDRIKWKYGMMDGETYEI